MHSLMRRYANSSVQKVSCNFVRNKLCKSKMTKWLNSIYWISKTKVAIEFNNLISELMFAKLTIPSWVTQLKSWSIIKWVKRDLLNRENLQIWDYGLDDERERERASNHRHRLRLNASLIFFEYSQENCKTKMTFHSCCCCYLCLCSLSLFLFQCSAMNINYEIRLYTHTQV